MKQITSQTILLDRHFSNSMAKDFQLRCVINWMVGLNDYVLGLSAPAGGTGDVLAIERPDRKSVPREIPSWYAPDGDWTILLKLFFPNKPIKFIQIHQYVTFFDVSLLFYSIILVTSPIGTRVCMWSSFLVIYCAHVYKGVSPPCKWDIKTLLTLLHPV